ncbi:hypothetical protein RJ035_008199 [Blastomyces gilchristii]
MAVFAAAFGLPLTAQPRSSRESIPTAATLPSTRGHDFRSAFSWLSVTTLAHPRSPTALLLEGGGEPFLTLHSVGFGSPQDHVVLSASSPRHPHHAVYASFSSLPSQHYPASSIHESVLSHSLLVLSLSTVGSPWAALIMAPLSCLAGPDKQSSSKTDVLAALDSLSTLDAIVSDSGYESGSVSDDEDDDDGQLPAEHYLALAESLDIAQLRQKRYSPNTQEKLDDTRDYWESSLETFWKWWHLVLKQETASGLNKDTIVKVEDVVAQVVTEKKLALVGRPKKNMYIEDVAEFARVILTTTEMTFVSGWQCIQMLFFLQLAVITASRPSAILHLRYRDIMLTLIRVPDGGRPRLFIFLKPEFTKRFLGNKALNEFKIPEIIFDPTLVLSPHICLLTMLFHLGGFKSISTTGPVLDSAEKLYSAKVLNDKRQQPLLLKDELLDNEITGFEEVAHPYNLRYAGAKAFNNSKEVTEALQNIMLQHADIRTFVKHYQVDIDVDAQGII